MRNELEEQLQVTRVSQETAETDSQYRVQSALKLLLDALIRQIKEPFNAAPLDLDATDGDTPNRFIP